MDHESHEHPLPDEVRAAIRELYAAPSEFGYWDSLHAKVMAKVNRIPTSRLPKWWRFTINQWTKGGLLAAAALLVALGLILLQVRSHDVKMAHDSLVAPNEMSVPSGMLSDRESGHAAGRTFRDVITP